jgi:hypothetical protein
MNFEKCQRWPIQLARSPLNQAEFVTSPTSGCPRSSFTLARIFWPALAVLPFLSIYLVHYASPLGVPTGFIHGDMPYYCANARAIFERGNGLAHPNAYDPDPQAPIIYFHWLIWILGFGIKKLGFEPGILFVSMGVIGSFLCSYVTLHLIETRLPEPRYRIALFLFTMWGGGLLCVGRAAQNLLNGRPAGESLFAYDPFDGWWFQNWGRNLVFPTEAVYHALAAAVWLAVLGRRWTMALVAATLLAATHPFSGLQILLILFAWLSILLYLERTWQVLQLWFVIAVSLACFLGYYLVFLESFEQHRALRETWSLAWTLDFSSLLLAYGPIGLIAVRRFLLERSRLDSCDFFLAICFAVSFLLAKHEWFVAPRQPLHFTRGYLWLPLALLALPTLQQLLTDTQSRLRPAAFAFLLLMLGALAASDNAAFIARQWQNQRRNPPAEGYFLTPAERDMFAWIDRQGFDGVLLSPDAKLSYLSATYTAVRPYVGHWSETPQRVKRTEEIRAWFEHGKAGGWLAGIDYILIAKKEVRSIHGLGDWELAYGNEDLLLFKRTQR